jgi:hypothetical protein
MGKNILAEWEKLRNFATDFNGDITKRYAPMWRICNLPQL